MTEQMKEDDHGGLFIAARHIPAPSTISPQAQQFLSRPLELSGPKQPSGTADPAAWKTYIAASNRWLAGQMEAAAGAFPADIRSHRLDEVSLHEVVPRDLDPDLEDSMILYIHGGAFIHGAGLVGAHMALPLAAMTRMRSLCVDYRMPPDHPFPVGLDDCVAAYRFALERFAPKKIAICGGSAGGGLAASLILKARDIGLPLPGACVLATPEADLTEAGDTVATNIGIDVVITERLTGTIELYAAGHDLRDPYLSPLFGDFTKGFAPTLLTSGTRDAFLSNTVLLHRALLRAGIEAELHVWEAMPHGGFFGAPEDGEVLAEQARFIRRKLRTIGAGRLAMAADAIGTAPA